MKKQRVLLLSDVFPCSNSSGGIVSQQLCHFLLEEKCSVFCALLKQEYFTEKVDDLIKQNIDTVCFPKPEENTKDKGAYLKQIKNISKEIADYIRKNDIDTIWCTLQGESLLRVLGILQTKFPKKRFVPQVWDPIEWVLHELNYTEKDTKSVLKLFERVIRKSDFVLTASMPMNEIYKKKYRVKCLPIFASYDYTPVAKPARKNGDFIIMLSGQTYAKKGIESLVGALNDMNWKCDERNIVLKYFGPNQNTFLTSNKHIIHGGYVTQEQLIENEREADLLYCSYFFDNQPAYRIVSEQSYPSKIVTYIPAQTPILIHADKNCSVYKNFEKYKCGFLLDSTKKADIAKMIKSIINARDEDIDKKIKNANKLFDDYFTKEKNKDNFMRALNIEYEPTKKYHILEVNNVDLPGKRWNGYDLAEYINKNTEHTASQICTYKTSNNKNVVKIYTPEEQELEYKLLGFEGDKLSVHSCLSASSPILSEKGVFQNADVVHLHLIHNMKLSLISLIELCNKKPTVITIHDPWTFTGHCVCLEDCNKFLTGCSDCPDLNRLFPLTCDNCHELWKLKKFVYDHLDVDYVVTTKYMLDLFNDSPLTKGKRVHLIPFGMDVDEFNTVTREQAREHYNIAEDEVVLFHRAQGVAKGTPYFVEALKELDTTKKITIITCSETGHLNSVKNKYRVIDLGNINSKELAYAYNACDIFVMPSISESFGMMSIEAMSCRKPVIVFNNTALPSVTFAPECGIAVENLNSHKLMEAIKWMVEDEKERHRRGELGRKLVEENYRLEEYNQKILNLYKEVASRKHDFSNLSILKQEPEETDSTIALKKQLNRLTDELFPAKSPEHKELFYDLPENINDIAKIEYGDFNVQLVLNQYNNAVVRCWREFNDDELYSTGLRKLRRKVKTFIRLLLTDRKKMIQVIGEKITGSKNDNEEEE